MATISYGFTLAISKLLSENYISEIENNTKQLTKKSG